MNSSIAPGPNREARVCVIGAGPCGLATLKNLLAAGLTNIVCYDESDAIGGNWVFRDDADRSSVYFSTHIISSKKLSEFEDYPMPADYPDFPHHSLIARYFESYVDHFAFWRIVGWLRKRHVGLSWGTLHRRFLPGWKVRDGRVEMFRPQEMAIVRYRYRGSKIPTPWASETTGSPAVAGLTRNRSAGSGRRPDPCARTADP